MNIKAVIITGANGAIGSFLTEQFLNLDYTVLALIHHNKMRISHLIDKFPETLISRQCDLTNYEKVKDVITSFTKDYNFTPTKLIHTSALRSSDFSLLADTKPQQWYNIVNTNIHSIYNILHVLLPIYQQRQTGKIVLIGSNISRTGLKCGSAYAVSKGALANLVRTVALEYGKDNILINTLSPGPVLADQSHFSKHYQEFRKSYFEKELKNTPLNKLVEPQDIFEYCCFLLSEKNRLISGEEIYITGGKL